MTEQRGYFYKSLVLYSIGSYQFGITKLLVIVLLSSTQRFSSSYPHLYLIQFILLSIEFVFIFLVQFYLIVVAFTIRRQNRNGNTVYISNIDKKDPLNIKQIWCYAFKTKNLEWKNLPLVVEDNIFYITICMTTFCLSFYPIGMLFINFLLCLVKLLWTVWHMHKINALIFAFFSIFHAAVFFQDVLYRYKVEGRYIQIGLGTLSSYMVYWVVQWVVVQIFLDFYMEYLYKKRDRVGRDSKKLFNEFSGVDDEKKK